MFRDKGFTLIELLVVLVIIGVLIAMIIPNTMRAITMANTKDCAANIRSIDTAIQMYYVENARTWPAAVADVAPFLSGGVVPTCKVDGTAYAIGADHTVVRGDHFTAFPDTHN